VSELGQNLGRIFEVGFNLGILNYIERRKINCNFGDLYRQDLRQISFSKMVNRLAKEQKIIDRQHREIVDKWGIFFLQKGFLSGVNFLDEYFQAIGLKERNFKRIKILYYQCSFVNDNSIGTFTKDIDNVGNDLISQFEFEVEFSNMKKYDNKGEFLHADTLMLIKLPKEYRLICIDYSIFAIDSIRDLLDVGSVEVIRKILLSELSYLKSKSVFANLSIDTGNNSFDLSESLDSHYTAFKRNDKESIKAIQAGSYAYSFLEFIRERQPMLIPEDLPLTVNIIGYSDRGVSSISLSREKLDILKTCHHIYKHEQKNMDIQESRSNILNLIKRNAIKSFEGNSKEFIDRLFNISADKINEITHEETLANFQNSADLIPDIVACQLGLTTGVTLRDAHSILVRKALESNCNYIFLTGNPGIGKTTAITEFLKSERCLAEGFLFIYISPRTQVNLDIIEKLTNRDDKSLCDDRIFTIDTNATLIKDNGGKCTVNYSFNKRQGDFQERVVHFIDRREEKIVRSSSQKTLRRKTEDSIEGTDLNSRGVLDSMAEAIYTVMNQQISNNIVATVSIQSLKKTHGSRDTLGHLDKIFRDIYNEKKGEVIEAKKLELAMRIKHIFIAIDEITGDESGVEFLNGISKLVNQYKLNDTKSGLNTKIIVADASIVETDVIKQHLSATNAEPNKIFFRKVSSDPQPLSYDLFEFNKSPAIVINANSYPASSLGIKYNLSVESINSNLIDKANDLKIHNSLQEQIFREIFRLLNSETYQIIVYIQDKIRLAELIKKIQEIQENFQHNQDYIEIHASLSERDKQDIYQYKDKVRVVFMTASASRGLSFPNARHILVDIPRFEIEKNLMEVIQVIYRGRGNNEVDRLGKQLIFYLSERAIYYNNEAEISLQESILNLLNVLIILKTSIVTRIIGSGKIGRDRYAMIPIGGKSVLAAGQTFSSTMDRLIKQLKKESHRQPQDDLLRTVFSNLESLLGSANIVLSDTAKIDPNIDRDTLAGSYLNLRNSLTEDFWRMADCSLENFLDFPSLEKAYISGGLLIVPLENKEVEEKYRMKIQQDIGKFDRGKLLQQMREIQGDYRYPDSLRSTLAGAIELVNILSEKPDRTQRFEDNSQYSDLYYAMPLFNFISSDVMSEYFSSDEEEPEDMRFRDILVSYIRSLYPVSSILPIGHKYKEFPFIVFRSYSLKEMRIKIFMDKYLLNSTELNILNLIFARSE
jgi:hypothetical protein